MNEYSKKPISQLLLSAEMNWNIYRWIIKKQKTNMLAEWNVTERKQCKDGIGLKNSIIERNFNHSERANKRNRKIERVKNEENDWNETKWKIIICTFAHTHYYYYYFVHSAEWWQWFKNVTTNAQQAFHAVDLSCRLASPQFTIRFFCDIGMEELKEKKKLMKKVNALKWSVRSLILFTH